VRGRLGRRRTRRGEVVERALGALQTVQGRFGQRRRIRRAPRTYGNALGLGIGVLGIALLLSLLFWLFRRTTTETAPATQAPAEGGVEAALPEEGVVIEEDVEVVAPGPPSAEEVPPREEPPPGEERPERRGLTPTAPPSREEPPPGEERPERR
jgi:hypothetical protein